MGYLVGYYIDFVVKCDCDDYICFFCFGLGKYIGMGVVVNEILNIELIVDCMDKLW